MKKLIHGKWNQFTFENKKSKEALKWWVENKDDSAIVCTKRRIKPEGRRKR